MTRSLPCPDFGHTMLSRFHLSPDVTHLNHGSYGATPIEVLEAQRTWQTRMEAEPSGFMEREFRPALRASAARLGDYLNAEPNQIALIENATAGVNAVLRGLSFEEGDEILITDQTYGAVRNAVDHVCQGSPARKVTVSFPVPLSDPRQVVAAFRGGLTPRTKLAIIDHVTSPTALVLPIAEMVAAARTAGALILVDGAHAPGMVPLDIQALNPDWYTGNCHKWLCAPKGCGFLWTASEHLKTTHPLVISHGFQAGYVDEFDWTGTRDGSAQFALTASFDFRDRFGDDQIMTHNTALAREAGHFLEREWATETGGPDEMTGSMTTVRLPNKFTPSPQRARELRAELLDHHCIQIPVTMMAGSLWVRLSAQIYNQTSDYERLARVIHELNGD